MARTKLFIKVSVHLKLFFYTFYHSFYVYKMCRKDTKL